MDCSEVDALMAAVLLGVAGADALDADAQAQPPHGQLAQAEQGVGAGKGTPLSVRIALGSPNCLKTRLKTVKAKISWVLDSASQLSR